MSLGGFGTAAIGLVALGAAPSDSAAQFIMAGKTALIGQIDVRSKIDISFVGETRMTGGIAIDVPATFRFTGQSHLDGRIDIRSAIAFSFAGQTSMHGDLRMKSAQLLTFSGATNLSGSISLHTYSWSDGLPIDRLTALRRTLSLESDPRVNTLRSVVRSYTLASGE